MGEPLSEFPTRTISMAHAAISGRYFFITTINYTVFISQLQQKNRKKEYFYIFSEILAVF